MPIWRAVQFTCKRTTFLMNLKSQIGPMQVAYEMLWQCSPATVPQRLMSAPQTRAASTPECKYSTSGAGAVHTQIAPNWPGHNSQLRAKMAAHYTARCLSMEPTSFFFFSGSGGKTVTSIITSLSADLEGPAAFVDRVTARCYLLTKRYL